MGCADQNPLQQSHAATVSRQSRGSRACTTRSNSTHEMCADTSSKCVVLDNIMDQYTADIGHDVLPDLEWHAIDGVSTFLRAPRQVMESFAANHKPTLDLVPMSISLF
jgi:hypothetical protein